MLAKKAHTIAGRVEAMKRIARVICAAGTEIVEGSMTSTSEKVGYASHRIADKRRAGKTSFDDYDARIVAVADRSASAIKRCRVRPDRP
jgi:hypothetical protein